jgi:hypothetical protein
LSLEAIVAQQDQGIPRSLALTVRMLRLRREHTQEQLSSALSDVQARFRKRRRRTDADDTWTRTEEITAKEVGDAERARRLTYRVMDTYARWSGHPTGMIYLVSRCGSELSNNKASNVEAIGRALVKFGGWLEANAGTLADSKRFPNPPQKMPSEENEQHERARKAVLDYLREVVEVQGKPAVKYAGSRTQRYHARLALLIDEILNNAPVIFTPAKTRYDAE